MRIETVLSRRVPRGHDTNLFGVRYGVAGTVLTRTTDHIILIFRIVTPALEKRLARNGVRQTRETDP
jgi:hypothetical protein